MPNLYITFGRATGNPPLMVASTQRSAVMQIGPTGQPQPVLPPVMSTLTAQDIDTAVDLYTDSDCWVDIGPDAKAGTPGSEGRISSFFMGRGERVRKRIDSGDKVSAVAA
jgi:hypothetical protein